MRSADARRRTTPRGPRGCFALVSFKSGCWQLFSPSSCLGSLALEYTGFGSVFKVGSIFPGRLLPRGPHTTPLGFTARNGKRVPVSFVASHSQHTTLVAMEETRPSRVPSWREQGFHAGGPGAGVRGAGKEGCIARLLRLVSPRDTHDTEGPLGTSIRQVPPARPLPHRVPSGAGTPSAQWLRCPEART